MKHYSLFVLLFVIFQLHCETSAIQEVHVPDDVSLLIPPHIIKAAQKFKKIDSNSPHLNFKTVVDPAEGCKICEELTGNIISLRRSNATKEVMTDYLIHLCSLYTNWGSEGCSGRVNIEMDTILYIIDGKKDLKPARFCAIYYQVYGCEDPEADDWSIAIPPYSGHRPAPVGTEPGQTLQILQITDVHMDPLYLPGSIVNCPDPMCCETGVPEDIKDAAGYWGDYASCDMPWHTMEDMLDQIKEKHELDYIYFTGDIVSHRTWATTIESNTDTIKQFLTLLKTVFVNTTVFPILGNHEPHPGDYYSPESVDKNSSASTQWLLDLAAKEWAKWLPNDTQTTLKKGGYYTVLVKPGFRVIALNSNVCYTMNLWLVYENKDTYGQLQWLVEVLTEAEKNGEKVHILAHLPVTDDDSDCVKVWSRELSKIILRFSDTITAQFNGHTHYDEFKLFFENNTTKEEVKAVAYNGASFTTIWGTNSNYRIYDVDSTNLTVTDYSEYTFNLTDANLDSETSPNWYQLYSFKDAYELPDLTFKSLSNLYAQMNSNDSDNSLVKKYYKYRYRNSDVFKEEDCDSQCKKKLVCMIAARESRESMLC
ncbi:sphingomyelin phosphodiesterase 1-like [Euwallacea fornicatus]|uniref:sphingomyelin phosphodiesterase 1-like n=1 Tax=Euwallacea fornicatus TaxID=995702 RepID=UPI00338E2D0F